MGLEAGGAAGRDRGRRIVRGLTWGAGLGGFALTAVLGLVAANSFGGHQAASAAAPSVSAADPGVASGDTVQPAPQPASPDSLGSSSRPPAAVSGGS